MCPSKCFSSSTTTTKHLNPPNKSSEFHKQTSQRSVGSRNARMSLWFTLNASRIHFSDSVAQYIFPTLLSLLNYIKLVIPLQQFPPRLKSPSLVHASSIFLEQYRTSALHIGYLYKLVGKRKTFHLVHSCCYCAIMMRMKVHFAKTGPSASTNVTQRFLFNVLQCIHNESLHYKLHFQ